jgi:hypothetical protein
LTTGLYNIGSTKVCGTSRIGGTHSNARGYLTIDVVANCSNVLPSNPAYYSTQILFDNALIGDYQQLSGESFASASPMVHIRAVPEGGPAGYDVPTSLPYTFYDRYTPAINRRMDRRVPLPSLFAVRWVESNEGQANTLLKIWREGVGSGTDAATCLGPPKSSQMTFESIRFDEHENSFGPAGLIRGCAPVCMRFPPSSAAIILASSSSFSFFPGHMGSPDIAGWLYLDLNNHAAGSRPSQNWVTAVMYAQGRYAVEFDAAQLGNGCTPAASVPSPEIGPAR